MQAIENGSGSDAEQPSAVKAAAVLRPAISSNLHLSHGLEPFKAPPLEELTDARLAECLKSAFGYGGFRGQQLEVIRRVLEGRSMLAVLPTGASWQALRGWFEGQHQGLVTLLTSRVHVPVAKTPHPDGDAGA